MRDGRHRVFPQLEALEAREAPAASPWLAESFDGTAVGGVPAGWAQWSSDGSASFAVSTQQPLSPANGLQSSSASIGATAAWVNTPLPENVTVGTAVLLNSGVPLHVFARGSTLASAQPSYYALAVSRGPTVQL